MSAGSGKAPGRIISLVIDHSDPREVVTVDGEEMSSGAAVQRILKQVGMSQGRGRQQCPQGCGRPREACDGCGHPACRSCDVLGWCRACWERLPWYAERPADIAAHAARPLDPEDDLRVFAAYPGQQRFVRELQELVKASGIYQVIHQIGGQLRADFLAATMDEFVDWDMRAAETFYIERVCRCPGTWTGLYGWGVRDVASVCQPCRAVALYGRVDQQRMLSDARRRRQQKADEDARARGGDDAVRLQRHARLRSALLGMGGA